MRRGWLSVLFVFILLGMSQTQALAIYESSPYVYRLKVGNCSQEPRARVLTGFRVQGIDGIITALHGVIGCESITAKSDDSNRDNIFRDLKIQKVDIERDVALLWSDDMEHAPAGGLEEAASDLPIGDLLVMGYPKGLSSQRPLVHVVLLRFPTLKELIPDNDPAKKDLDNRQSPSLEITVLDLQTSLLPGHSGAPLLTPDNKVYGVANGGLEQGTIEISWAIPWNEIEWQPVTVEQARLNELLLNSPLSGLSFSSTFPAYETVEFDSESLPIEEVRSYRASYFISMNGTVEQQDVEGWLSFITSYNEDGEQGSLIGIDNLYADEEPFLIFSNQDNYLSLEGFQNDCLQLEELPENIGDFVEQVEDMLLIVDEDEFPKLGTYLGPEEINGVNTDHYLLSDPISLSDIESESPNLELTGLEIWVTVEGHQLRKVIYEIVSSEDAMSDQSFVGNMYVEIEYSDVNTDFTVDLPLACQNVSLPADANSAGGNGQAIISEPVPVQHNVTTSQGPGMVIKPTFAVNDPAAGSGLVIARIFESGIPLLTYSPETGALDGIFQAQTPFTPPFDSEEFEIFVPYEDLSLSDGTHDLKLRLFVYDISTNAVLAASEFYDFSLWQQTDEAGNPNWLSDDYTGLQGISVVGKTEISPLEESVGKFLSHAFEAETRAYRDEDPSVAEPYFGGSALLSLQETIDDFQQQGLVLDAGFDEQNSFIVNINVIDDNMVEVDVCESWRVGFVSDELEQSVLEAEWRPQTIVLERSTGDWWSITDVADYPDDPVCALEYLGLQGISVAGKTEISPLEEDVGQFLSLAFEAETWAYRYEDPSVAEPYFGGSALSGVQERIDDFQQQGLVLDAGFDEQNSFIVNLNVIDDNTVEVDVCESLSGGFVSDELEQSLLEAEWRPQTIILEGSTDGWWSITDVVDYPHDDRCNPE